MWAKLFMQKRQQLGLSLLELMVAVVILTILVAVGYPSYQKYVRQARLKRAVSAMMENAQALERHYAGRGHFKQNSTTWMTLPITQTEHFCIKLQGNPRGTNNDRQFSMKAVALDKNKEPRVLLLNQDGVTQICERSSSTCEEKDYFRNPSRSDSDCLGFS